MPPDARHLSRESEQLFSRRQVLTAGAGALGAGVLGWQVRRATEPHIALYTQTVALDGADARYLMPADADPREHLHDGSRVRRHAPDAQALLASEQDFLRPGLERIAGLPWQGMARDALLDLHTLSMGLPAPVAGWTDRWRYIWPRDTAHVIVLLAQLGHSALVVRALEFLSRVQRRDGWFEARYRIDGQVPDDRRWQADGAGWFLWAIAGAMTHLPHEAQRISATMRPAVAAALEAISGDLERGGGLPSPSPDYWEVPETQLTLGTAAVLLAGVQALARVQDEALGSGRAGALAEGLAGALRAHFEPHGFSRYGHRRAVDSAITFLLPPYCAGFEEVVDLLPAAWRQMARPAGGIAPGKGWKDGAISWTPETALFAQAWMLSGDTSRSGRVLDWLDAHRTAAGSLPEKVLANGSPAAVAPLAWTAALVLSSVMAHTAAR